jgi:hypothetical protein
MEQPIFAFWLVIEGTTETVLQLLMQLKSIYNKNLGFVGQKLYFWTLQRGSNKKKLLIDILFCRDMFSPMTFSELPSIGVC